MIVGVDVSSRRIDLAWLEDNRPCRWHQELAKGHLIDRLRSISITWPYPYEDPTTEIAIEMPFGRSRASVSALMATVGVVTSRAPKWARVAWPSAGELRAAIGARNTKDSATIALHSITCAGRLPCQLPDWDEHELDALTACIGWTRILEQQEGAA